MEQPLYKDKKFKSTKAFDQWLKKLTKYKIYFVDSGQDFLEWFLDKRGEVLHYCAPFQSSTWNGTMVDVKHLAVGEMPLIKTIHNTRKTHLIHRIIKIETMGRPKHIKEQLTVFGKGVKK